METVNDEERATALNEVQILKVLNHPNIVLYIDSKLEKQALLIRISTKFTVSVSSNRSHFSLLRSKSVQAKA